MPSLTGCQMSSYRNSSRKIYLPAWRPPRQRGGDLDVEHIPDGDEAILHAMGRGTLREHLVNRAQLHGAAQGQHAIVVLQCATAIPSNVIPILLPRKVLRIPDPLAYITNHSPQEIPDLDEARVPESIPAP